MRDSEKDLGEGRSFGDDHVTLANAPKIGGGHAKCADRGFLAPSDQNSPADQVQFDNQSANVGPLGEGHARFAAHLQNADPEQDLGADQPGRDNQTCRVSAEPGEGQRACANHDASADSGPHSETVAAIRDAHRRRCYAMEQRKRADLSLGSFLRLVLGWSLALPDADRKRINEQAQALMALGETEAKGKPLEVEEPAYDEWRDVILASIAARAPFDQVEKSAHSEMEKLAKSLPIWAAWGEGIKGFGPASLAVIVGEAGDLSGYANPAKLWKRMGLTVMDGVRQGGLGKNAPKEAWIAHGYNKMRRSRMWNIGEALMKNNKDEDGAPGPYRTLFLERLVFEHEKAVAAGLIPSTTTKTTVESWEKRGLPPLKKITDAERKKAPEIYRGAGHMTRRAQRYVEKRLLRDLWRAWRRAEGCAEPKVVVPAAPILPASDQEAA